MTNALHKCIRDWKYIFDPNKPHNKGLQVIPKDPVKIPDFSI